MDDLRRMAIFAAVVEAGSFTGAARQMGLTKSAVSKQVKVLESQYQVQLLHRTTRRLRLTEAGESFYRDCAQMVDVATGALASLREQGSEPTGTLSVSAPIGIGEQLLAPLLQLFLREYSKIDVEVRLQDERIHLVEAGIDVAIRAGQLSDSSLIAKKLAPMEMVLCCAPSYASAHGVPAHPSELSSHAWLGFGPLGTPQPLRLERGGQSFALRLKGRVQTNNGVVLRQLLLDGAGISVLPKFHVGAALEAGSLQAILPEYSLPQTAIYAVYPAFDYMPTRVRCFLDFLATHIH